MTIDKWGGQHGLFKTEDFPEGWVVKTKKGEPRRETRIHFVKDWREEVKELEEEKDYVLFDNHDNNALLSLLWKVQQ